MSRIGKLPIEIPEKVDVKLNGNEVIVKGIKGELKIAVHPKIKVEVNDKIISIEKTEIKGKGLDALRGLFRSLIFNMVEGVSKGFEKRLEINGIGYKAAAEKGKLIIHAGFSHPVEFSLPNNVEAKVEKNIIILASFDKQLLGQVAADIRKIRKPEPYKGKGIKYADEVIIKKAGKAAKGGEK